MAQPTSEFEELRRQLEQVQKLLREAEEEIRKTTLTEYLGLCHERLSMSISIETDKTRSTKGDPGNADKKVRPYYLQPWDDFLVTQKKTLESLYSLYPSNNMPRVFDTRNQIQGQGAKVASRKLASELDLQILQRDIIETPVTLIMEHLRSLDDIRNEFGLGGGIMFYNHANALGDDAEEVAERLEAQQLEPFTPRPSAPSKFRIWADQICVHTTVDGMAKTVLIVEYKAPHKLTLAHLRHVLRPDRRPLELAEVIDRVKVPPPTDLVACFENHAEHLVAAVVTQAFSYMVKSGTQYGYITTGEAFVFLHIKLDNDAKTVYCHLAEPNADVNAQKEAYPNTDDHLHRTAISQVLAFSVLALRSAQGDLEWRERVIGTLKTWQVDDGAILSKLPETPEIAEKLQPFLSEYRPQTYSLDVPDRSPIRRRLRPRKMTCLTESNPTSKDDHEPTASTDDDSSPLDTPVRPQGGSRGKRGSRGRQDRQGGRTQSTGDPGPSSREGQRRVFCTQLCLQGLVRGGPLDRQCPNVSKHCKEEHQSDRHELDGEEFEKLLGEQLRRSRGNACQPLGMQGARGALFMVTLTSHGYTVAGKGTVPAFIKDLRHEAEAYRRLRTLQGIHVPIYLGSIDLDSPYYYGAGIRIVHLMLLSWAGEGLDETKILTDTDKQRWTSDLVLAVKAIHGVGVLHQDIRMPNLLWNKETKRVMMIDFERAEILADRQVLRLISPNTKRKRISWPKESVKINGKDMLLKPGQADYILGGRMEVDMWQARTIFDSK
ncbi:hypothetical protein MMC19_001469 [Ptychographa xylographoides]|nr:hypothetical protein [Ptychographa xylographoides]